MKPKKPAAHHLKAPALALASLALIQSTAHAATISKADNSDNLNLTTSWTGSVVPGTADIAQWDSTVTSANTTLLGGNLSFSGLKVTNPAGAVTISANDTLTVGTSGIDLSAASQDLTIGSGVTLSGKQSWKSSANRTLSVSGTVSQGTGNVDLSNFRGSLGALSNNSTTGILGPWVTTGGALATAVATIDGAGTVTGLNLVGDNTGYSTAPTVTIQGPASGTTATATATATIDASGSVTGFTITNAGSGYTSIPRVNITATANRINYAKNTAGAVSAYTAQTAATAADLSNVTSATTNYSFGAAGNLTANITANTLRFQGATCTLVNTNNKTITLNGLMSAGNTGSGSGGVLTVGSAGAATSSTNQIKIGNSGVLNITTAVDNTFSSGSAPSSSMVINMPITGIGSSVVVNAGAKDLILLGSGTTKTTNPRSTFSRMFINSGYVRLPVLGDGTLGGYSTVSGSTVTADGALVTIAKGAELRLDRNNIVGSLTLNGGTLSYINSFGDTWSSATNQSYITLNQDSTLYSGNSGNLTVNVPIVGSGGLTKTGATSGTLNLTANNTYSGKTIINGGIVAFKKPGALYNADVTKWTAENIIVSPVQSPLTASAPLPTIQISLGGTDGFTTSQLVTLLSNLSSSANGGLRSGSYFAFNTSAATEDIVIPSDLSNEVNYKMSGKGNVTLSGNSTFSGKIAVDGVSLNTGLAQLTFSSLNSVTTNATLGTVHSATSNLGAPTTVANGTIDLGNPASQSGRVTLKYTGTGETTDRVLNFGGQWASSVIIEQSGTGLLKFVSPFTFYGASSDDDKDVILKGDTAGTGEIAGAIADPTLGGSTNIGLSKRGTGTWTLSGANTYTGGTSIWNGTLIIGGAGQLGGGSYSKDISLSSNASPESGGGQNTEIFFNSSANQTLSSWIYSNGSTGTLRKSGASTLTLAPIASVNALATATVSGGAVTAITVTSGTGTGYNDVPVTVTIQGNGSGATATATADVDFWTGNVNVTLTSGGSGYTSAPTVTITAAPAPYRTNAYDNTIVEAGVLATNGYALYDDSSLTITDGKVSVTNGQTEIVKYLFLGETAQVAGTYGPTGSGATYIDDVHFSSGSGMVSVLSNPPSNYPTWATTNGLTGADADPTADLDGDGVINALEFVLGGAAGDPQYYDGTNSIGLLPTSSKNSNGEMVFTFNRTDTSERGSTLVFQWSTDLTFPDATATSVNNVTIGSSSATTNGVSVTVTENGAADDTIVIKVPSSKAVNGKIFGRLSATVRQ
jgi:autotransporter-associated beta strand protein